MMKMLFFQIKHITYATLSGDICDRSAFFVLTQEGREETKQKKRRKENNNKHKDDL